MRGKSGCEVTTYPDCVCCGAVGCGSCPGDQCRDCDLYCSSTSHCDRARSAPEQPAKPSPAWVWSSGSVDYSAGKLGKETEAEVYEDAEGRMHANATIDMRTEGGLVELHTTLPAWSISQCKRWVEQWVASQSDAAVAAFEAAEGMR